MAETVELLLAAGYFRARIKGLSPFDKVGNKRLHPSASDHLLVFPMCLLVFITYQMQCYYIQGCWRHDMVHISL